MSEKNFHSFEEFWPYYVKAHSKKGNRRLHFVGTTGAMALIGAGMLTRKGWMIALGPVVGYGCAWIGHFFIEKNVPATFGNPLYSLRADFVMWTKIVDGTMDAEVERVLAADTERPAEPAAASAGVVH